jgi:hypothetical protein
MNNREENYWPLYLGVLALDLSPHRRLSPAFQVFLDSASIKQALALRSRDSFAVSINLFV